MKKTLRTSQNLYQDVADLMTMMYQVKGAEMVNNEEIAEEIQNAIVETARKNIFEATEILQQIYNETYDD